MNLKVLYELVDDGQRQLFVSVDDGRCTCESLDIVLIKCCVLQCMYHPYINTHRCIMNNFVGP